MGWCWVRQMILQLLILITMLVVFLSSWGWVAPSDAIAAIRQLEEAPGQVVYQSRQTLTDQSGKSWQAIAFKRIRPDGSNQFYLRLVGFPGTVTINHFQPLILKDSMGKTLTAADVSSQIFTDTSSPEPHVGQYDLQPLLPQLHAELPWRLSLPTTDGKSLTLQVSPSLMQEWKTLADL
ncbi:MAG: DUF3122 domain-containing protein [Elainellaceae cyanobacterium]